MKRGTITALIMVSASAFILAPISAQLSSPICPIWGPNVNRVDETSAVIQYKTKNPAYPYNFTIHEILFDGLIPNSSYSYSLFRDSENYTFRTAPSDGAPQSFSFGFYGDNRGTHQTTDVTETYYTIISDMLKHQPDFIIEAGDLIEAGDGAKPELREKQWDNFRLVRDDAQHEIPMYAAIGNHDDPENIAEVTFEDIFSHWGNERYYSFDYGFSHFTIIDPLETNYQLVGEQLEWLKNDLASSNAVYKFVISHYAFNSRWDSGRGLLGFAELIGEPEQATELWDILEDNSITAYLASHDHLYDRILLGDRNISQVVVAGGGATLYIPSSRQINPETGEQVLFQGKPSFAAYGYGYSIISVDWNRIQIDAYALGNYSLGFDEGVLFDTFEFPTPYEITDSLSITTSHSPASPVAGGNLEITTNLVGDSSPTTVTLFYSKDGIDWEKASMSFNQDHYEYTIPSLLNNSTVQYYVVANDSANHRGLSDIQSITIGTPLVMEEVVYLGPLINSSGCTAYSQIPSPSTGATTTTTTTPIEPTSTAPGFLLSGLIAGVLFTIFKKKKQY
ncbi:MAG: metallophosphoesterase family protein [Candidatus Hodarchaeales archaeon]